MAIIDDLSLMTGPPDRNDDGERQPLWRRLAWMAAIWVASVAMLGTVAMIIRWWLRLA